MAPSLVARIATLRPNAPAPGPDAAAHRRARASLAGVVAASLILFAIQSLTGRQPDVQAAGTASPAHPAHGVPPTPQLPGGGRTIFPGHRVVAFYGAPLTARLGILGEGPPDEMFAQLKEQAAIYARPGHPVLVAGALIATIASTTPESNGLYTFGLGTRVVQRYLDAARRAGAPLILDIRPGRSRFLTQAKPYERFLAQPDVELALDPEWRVGPTQVPGRQLGSVDAAEVNQVTTWLSGIVTAHHLPQKLLILHLFRESMITNRDQISRPSQLAVTFDVDGVGDRRAKGLKYQSLAASTKGFYLGIKLYYHTDTQILQPVNVLRLRPHPDLVIYQ